MLPNDKYRMYYIVQSILRYETSKSKLEGQERALTAAYNRECKQNEELRQKGYFYILCSIYVEFRHMAKSSYALYNVFIFYYDLRKQTWNETIMEQEIFEGKRVDMEKKLAQVLHVNLLTVSVEAKLSILSKQLFTFKSYISYWSYQP